MTEQRFSEQRFPEDVAIGEMLFNSYREQVYHSQREGLSFGQSSSMSDRTEQPVVETMAKSHDRTGQPVVETGQEQNPEHAQIRTLLDRQTEQILTDCQAEIKKHEFQANYDRREDATVPVELIDYGHESTLPKTEPAIPVAGETTSKKSACTRQARTSKSTGQLQRDWFVA